MKKNIIIVIIVVINLVICFLVINLKNTNKKKDDILNKPTEKEKIKYLIFHGDVVLKKMDKGFIRVKDKSYNEEKFFTFEDGKYIGNNYYRIDEFDKYLFDEDYNPIIYKGNLVLNNYDEDMKICNLATLETDDNDLEMSQKMMEDFNEKYKQYVPIVTKYGCDLNNDGQEEYIYSLSFGSEYMSEIYSMVYLYADNKAINLSLTSDAVLLEVMDADSDNILEIVTAEVKNNKSCYKFLKYVNGEIDVMNTCD